MILLAINDPDTRTLLQDELAGAGYDIWPIADGEELVEVTQNLRSLVDVVVVEGHMPSRCGAAVIAELRAAGIDVPIVVVLPELEMRMVERNTWRFDPTDDHTFFVAQPIEPGDGLLAVTAGILCTAALPRSA